jgi:acyl-CoA thioesterase-1
MTEAPRPCIPHLDLVGFKHPLPHLIDSLKRQRRIKIVAIGSSSTAGVNGVIPYPPRLELLLRDRYYGRMIDVINRGLSSQESPEELSRLECDVIAEAPQLVIWQVGTNSVYRKVDYSFDAVQQAIAVGLNWLAVLPMDVVLMDLQYTKAIVDHVDLAEDIEARIMAVGETAKVNVFRRWALMKRWYTDGGISLSEMDDAVEPHLHTSDWATRCISQALDLAIGQAVGPVPGAPPPPTV